MAIQKRGPRQPDSTDVEVGQLVRVQRVERGMSQAELGRRIGVSLQQVHQYEGGNTRISMGRLARIAKALEIDVLYLLGASRRPGPATAGSNPKEHAKFAEGARMLGLIGALRLLRAFAAIPSKPASLRESIVRVVEGAATAARVSEAPEPAKRR